MRRALVAVMVVCPLVAVLVDCVPDLPPFAGEGSGPGVLPGADGQAEGSIQPGPGVFSLVLQTPATYVKPGEAADVTASLTRGSYLSPVTITLADHPSFAATSVTVTGTSLTFKLPSKAEAPQGRVTLSFDVAGEGLVPSRVDLVVSMAGRPGELDLSFGQGGVVTLPGSGSIHAIALDGEFIVLAGDDSTAGAGDTDRRMGTARLNLADGSNLFTYSPSITDISDASVGIRAMLRFDANIVFGGYAKRRAAGNYYTDAVLLALHRDGGRDTSFGTAGVVVNTFGGPTDAAAFTFRGHEDLTVLNGDIVAAGLGSGVNDEPAVAGFRRYTASGVQNGSFTRPNGVPLPSQAWAVIGRANGEIVYVGEGNKTPFLYRDTDGGANGTRIPLTGFPLGGRLFDVISDEGDLVVGGIDSSVVPKAIFGRIRASSASNAAIYNTDFRAIRALARDASRRILAAGLAVGERFAIARFDTNGGADLTGRAPKAFESVVGQWEEILIQPDGKILVAGETGEQRASEVADFLGKRVVARYWP